ncbi:ATP-binding protein [Aestuariivirga sp.]|uniref:ATP-binding protein n=1 Tax=Aestuariivirga sp. TaxID=2650926 RepID=UPI003BAC3AF1
MVKTLLRPGPGWLIITVVVALFTLEITALSVATHVVAQNSRAADLLRLLERVDGAMRAIKLAPAADRQATVKLLDQLAPGVSLGKAPLVNDPVASDDELAETEDILLSSVAARGAIELRVAEDNSGGGTRNPMSSISSQDPGPVETGLTRLSSSYASSGRFIASIQLSDGMWLNLSSPRAPPPPLLSPDSLFWYVVLSGLVVAACVWAVRQLTAPYRQLEKAVTDIGHDLRVAPIDETGSNPARGLIRAINTMQQRLKNYVSDYEYLAVALAHDLRTPLTRIRLRCELIQQEAGEKIVSDVHDIEEIVNSVLDFARSGVAPPANETVDLLALAEGTADDFPGVEVAEETEAVPLLISSDSTGLKRCLYNLIQNARCYGDTVRIVLKREREDALILVEDNGPGIPARDLREVLRPFYRGEGSRNRASGGIGLGLAITNRIVQSLGGQLELENRLEGGLRAIIRLPQGSFA